MKLHENLPKFVCHADCFALKVPLLLSKKVFGSIRSDETLLNLLKSINGVREVSVLIDTKSSYSTVAPAIFVCLADQLSFGQNWFSAKNKLCRNSPVRFLSHPTVKRILTSALIG